MGTGTTIQVFLPDGNPRSLKIAEITNRTVQAILIQTAMWVRWKKGDGNRKVFENRNGKEILNN
jgi:hypothetical protein